MGKIDSLSHLNTHYTQCRPQDLSVKFLCIISTADLTAIVGTAVGGSRREIWVDPI